VVPIINMEHVFLPHHCLTEAYQSDLKNPAIDRIYAINEFGLETKPHALANARLSRGGTKGIQMQAGRAIPCPLRAACWPSCAGLPAI